VQTPLFPLATETAIIIYYIEYVFNLLEEISDRMM
jgi:hypothetical protein